MSLSSGSLLTSSVGVSSSFVVDFSSPPPLSGVIRLISSHLHRVVGSVLEARRMMKEGNTCGHLEHTMLVQLATTYRSLLTAPLLGSQQPLTPAQQEEETARDLLLQLFKCLLPYAPSASAVHELLKIIEGIDHKQVGHASKTESGTSPSTAFGALIPDPSASSMSWPFALCGMLIDACSTSPSIPYVLFDGEAPSTLVITALSAAVWPPGIAPTQPTAAAAAALAQNNPSIGIHVLRLAIHGKCYRCSCTRCLRADRHSKRSGFSSCSTRPGAEARGYWQIRQVSHVCQRERSSLHAHQSLQRRWGKPE